jgi:hypothetical protein
VDRRELLRAIQWFHTAVAAARETQDGPLESWILSRQAMVPLNFGAPRAAADIAAHALAVAGRRTSASMALAASVAARSYAPMGRDDLTLANLDLAERAFAQLDDTQTTDTWLGYPEQKHYIHASQALTLAGSTARAYVVQSRALEPTRSPRSMSAALIEVDRATCLIAALLVQVRAYLHPRKFHRLKSPHRARAPGPRPSHPDWPPPPTPRPPPPPASDPTSPQSPSTPAPNAAGTTHRARPRIPPRAGR